MPTIAFPYLVLGEFILAVLLGTGTWHERGVYDSNKQALEIAQVQAATMTKANAEIRAAQAAADDWDEQDDKDIAYGISEHEKYLKAVKKHPMASDCKPDADRLLVLKELRTGAGKSSNGSGITH